jgi:hypothetical protein
MSDSNRLLTTPCTVKEKVLEVEALLTRRSTCVSETSFGLLQVIARVESVIDPELNGIAPSAKTS